jgi:hypothetical protein
MTGFVRVGLFEKTKLPVPVSSVTAAARLLLLGVPNHVATLLPNPLTPVLIGRPVALVSVADAGVPKAGEMRVGPLANTRLPVPVSSVTAEARFALDGVTRKAITLAPAPVTPVLRGSPVALVNTSAEGVPRAGVVRVGEVRVLLVRVWVAVVWTP